MEDVRSTVAGLLDDRETRAASTMLAEEMATHPLPSAMVATLEEIVARARN